MDFKPMTILIIEDDVDACNKFRECAKRRNDIQIVKITDSDIDGLEYAKGKRPEGIILDLELNNSSNGNVSSIGIVSKLRKISPNYELVIIVTTHVNSKRTYEILHRDNVDLIMYKEQANYSSENVFNTLLTYRKEEIEELPETYELEKQDLENKISKSIDRELDLIGITEKMKGRRYIHDAIMFLVQNEDSDTNVIRYLTKKHQRTESTITNGIQNAISHAWAKTPLDELMKNYTAVVSYKTGEPTPMELIYHYAEKIRKEI